MKRLLSIAAVALITGSFFASPAQAQFAPGPNINFTQAQLQARVNSGIRTGALTRSEAASLQRKLQRFAQLEASMRSSNGRLSFKERNRLNIELANLGVEINNQCNDSDRAWNNRFHTNNRFHMDNRYGRWHH